MDSTSYVYKNLESKYGGFIGPAFTLTIGSEKIDNSKTQIPSLTVDIETGQSAGGCRFVVESRFDYDKGIWENDISDSIEVGAKIKIEAGYTVQKEIFFGFVDDFTVEYPQDQARRLIVSGIDAKGYLMNANGNKYMSEESTKDVIEKILNDCVSKGYASEITVGNIQKYNAQLIQEEADDYKFLCFLAEMHNMQFFVVNGEIVFDSLTNNTKQLVTLTLGVNLISFSKTVTLRNQVGKVIVYGIDPITKKPISGESESTSISGSSGKQASEQASGFKSVIEKEYNHFVSTPEECQKLAQARFDARALNFVSGKGKCIGLPELIPGRYIKLEGLDKRSVDIYFITKVTHDYSTDNGYFTTFEVKGAKSK
jgi:phage protein D